MMPTSDPYIQIDKVGVELRVYGIDAKRSVRAGNYDIYVNGEWFTVYASEPRISTGGPPIRAIDLYGTGISAEIILVLEATLLANTGIFEMRNADGEFIEVDARKKTEYDRFSRLRSLLYVFGVFFLNAEENEFQCLFNIDGGGGFAGVALEEYWRGERALVITELTLDQQITLVQAIVKRQRVLAEKISWIR